MALLDSNSLYSALVALDGLLEASGADGSDVDVVLQLITDNIAMHGLRGAILAPLAGWARHVNWPEALETLVSGDAPLVHASRFVEALMPTFPTILVLDHVMLKACIIGATSLVETLIDKWDKCTNVQYITMAAIHDNVSIVRALLARNVQWPEDLIVQALNYYNKKRCAFSLDALRLIIADGRFNVHADNDGALYKASSWLNATDIVTVLLDAGLRADVCERATRVSPLVYFVDDENVVRRLLAAGASTQSQLHYPLHVALSAYDAQKREGSVRAMLEHTNFVNPDVIARLWHAVFTRDNDDTARQAATRLLLDCGVRVTEDALKAAIQRYDVAVTDLLVDANASVMVSYNIIRVFDSDDIPIAIVRKAVQAIVADHAQLENSVTCAIQHASRVFVRELLAAAHLSAFALRHCLHLAEKRRDAAIVLEVDAARKCALADAPAVKRARR